MAYHIFCAGNKDIDWDRDSYSFDSLIFSSEGMCATEGTLLSYYYPHYVMGF